MTDLEFFEMYSIAANKGLELNLTIVSDSMSPAIEVGKRVTVKKFSSYQKFDVIVFFQDNKLKCHYITHINKHSRDQFCITRGLNTDHDDAPIKLSQILGKVTNVKLRYPLKCRLFLKELLFAR